MHQLLLPCCEAQSAFSRLHVALTEGMVPHNSEVADEVKERLEFICFSITEIGKLADEHMGNVERMRNGVFDSARPARSESVFFRIKFYTEALYMHAFRVRDAITHKAVPIPGLSGFEAPGVRNVRNHLLVHPEGKASLIFSQSFQWGPASGPIIKPRRSADEAGRHEDRGLVHNMSEFFANFTCLTERVAKTYVT